MHTGNYSISGDGQTLPTWIRDVPKHATDCLHFYERIWTVKTIQSHFFLTDQ